MQSTKANNRKALSLRVPASLAEKVEGYAKTHGLKKTDAYVHFIEMGLDQDSQDIRASLSEIDSKLDTLQALLGGAGAGTETVPLETEAVLDAISNASAHYPGIERALLFGSYARNQQNADSDIDIRLELDRSVGFNLHDLASFSKMIEQVTDKECDVITTSTIRNRSLARAIERDGVCAYERKDANRNVMLT